MSQPEKYDLVVLGSGEGGKFIALSLGSQGKRSAVAPAQREGRRIAPKLFGAMVHAKKIPMEERSQ
jgi:pyruvate/2-oxoglutarate dehydrogenase complex dihydrolipoamide dehydrogenase (E3) component